MILLAASIVLGLFVVDDFGPSWDETYNDQAGARALSAYSLGSFLQYQNDDYIHGTFYFMLYSGLSHALGSSAQERLAIRHYLNLLTFILAVVAAYYLVDRLVSRRAALLSAVLMLTQPLFLGHAFINQKDIPFLAFFTASVALGVYAVRRVEEEAKRSVVDPREKRSLTIPLRTIPSIWRQAPRRSRAAFALLGLLTAAIFTELMAEWIIYPTLEKFLNQAYVQEAPELANRVFRIVAEGADKTPLDVYQLKLRSAYTLLVAVAIPFGLGLLLLAWHRLIGPVLLRPPIIQDSSQWLIVLAGAVLGLTCAIRVIGPFAGLLVGMYMLVRLRRRSTSAILIYGISAVVATYLAWPALWGDPIHQYWSRINEAAAFSQSHNVFFNGAMYESTRLPTAYLPTFLVVQLTLPLLLGFPVGLFAALRATLRGKSDGALLIVLILWFGVPFLTQILLAVPLYGNMRQMLFITVPVALFAGMGWEQALRRLKYVGARWIFAALMIAPGAYHIVKFHPYEYVYYNALVGGVRGAVGRFEMDHWCTAYGELTEWLNQHAPPNAKIHIWGPFENVAELARSDLNIESAVSSRAMADYRMACSRALRDDRFFLGTQSMFEVRRDGALFGKLALVREGASSSDGLPPAFGLPP